MLGTFGLQTYIWNNRLKSVLLLAGCRDDRGTPSAGRTPSGPTEGQVRERCLSGIPDDAPVRGVSTLRGDGIATPAVDIGPATTSRTALVLLPQVNAGLCGWGKFATYAATKGVSSVLVDLCGYGDSACSEAGSDDVVGQVDLAADHLRTLGAERVVVVGVSMGGSQSVRATAGGADVDAWADLSGPPSWDGDRLLDLADRIDLPGFVGYARSDGALAYASAQRLARRTGADFVDGGHGHGWEMLTSVFGRPRPFADRLLEFVTGVA